MPPTSVVFSVDCRKIIGSLADGIASEIQCSLPKSRQKVLLQAREVNVLVRQVDFLE
jgi:hypothetical protein